MPLRVKNASQKIPWSQLSRYIKIPASVLADMAKCFIHIFIREAKKDFAKRGWSLEDPRQGPPLHESFSFQLKGGEIQIQSSFWGLDTLVSQDIPAYRMPWLTQEAKAENPSKYAPTKTERAPKVFPAKKVKSPLIVPMKAENGDIIFRTAPLTRADAWVHPKIAKFTFIERALKQINQKCEDIVLQEIVKQLACGNPLK